MARANVMKLTSSTASNKTLPKRINQKKKHCELLRTAKGRSEGATRLNKTLTGNETELVSRMVFLQTDLHKPERSLLHRIRFLNSNVKVWALRTTSRSTTARPNRAFSLCRNVIWNRRLLAWQKVERHDLTGWNVLFHMAMEQPYARIVNFETNHGPTPAEQADHVLLQRAL